MRWVWVPFDAVLAIHEERLAEHGGLDGIRDLAGVESALGRPVNLSAYGSPDVADLAASYLFGLAKNHGFNDGNKRTAWMVANVFLDLNGCEIVFDAADAYQMVCGVADGSVSEEAMATWIRKGLRRI